MSDEQPLPDLLDEERQAIIRIALSPDGHLLHRYLRRILETVYDTPQTGALKSHNGRRTLARDLMREMAKGIEESSGARRTEPADQPILTGRGQPASGRRRLSTREWLASQPEPASGE